MWAMHNVVDSRSKINMTLDTSPDPTIGEFRKELNATDRRMSNDSVVGVEGE